MIITTIIRMMMQNFNNHDNYSTYLAFQIISVTHA